MEIVLPQFNIETAINSHWEATRVKSEMIQRDRLEAESAATNALTQQFKRELDTYLDGNIQVSLGLKVNPPKEIASLAVFGIFTFGDYQFVLKRDSQNWEIAFDGKIIVCPPDLLQKTLLLELGRIKNVQQEK